VPTRTDAPKVFMSYSWSSVEHEQWVLELAEKLMSDGVNVILDKWDLKEGQDKYAFMERMVTDADVYRVLMICDEDYALKADGRRGGVGTETQIISAEVYSKVEQDKFIPIIAVHNSDGEPYLPAYLSSRIYIDLSSVELLFSEYEKLLRNIFDRPATPKPVLGTPPSHIFEESPQTVITLHKFAAFKDAITREAKHAEVASQDYLDALLNALEGFRIKPDEDKEKPLDEKVVESLRDFMPYRDEFVEYIRIVCQYGSDNYFEQIFEFLEKSISFVFPPAGVSSWQERWFDNYRFILRELFLYLIAILVKYRKYDAINLFVEELYYYSTSTRKESSSFTILDIYISTLDDERNKRLQLRRISVMADLIKERATIKDVPFDELMQTDLILILRSVFSKMSGLNYWFPRTLVWAERRSEDGFDLFYRAQTKRHFENLRKILNVQDKADLVKKFEAAREGHNLANFRFDYWPIPFATYMNLSQLDTM